MSSSNAGSNSSASFALLAQLPEDALVVVFQFLPASSHSIFSCVCRQWYQWSCYSDVFAELLSHRVRYWIDWMRDQATSNQTLEALLHAHPLLTSEEANQQLELVTLSHESHPTSISAATRLATSLAAAKSGSSTSSSTSIVPKRVTIQTAQLLNLVEIVCSGFRSGVRRTQESHTHSLNGALLRPLQTFPLQMLDLSNYAFVDAPLIRALLHLPALSSIRLKNCKMLTDTCVGLILSNHSLRSRLIDLDVSDNRQLTGKGWFIGPTVTTQSISMDQQDDVSESSSLPEDETTVIDEASPILSNLTYLNISRCGNILPQNLGSHFFSSSFLAPIRTLRTEGCNGKLVVAFFKSAHHLRNLREWYSTRCSSTTMSAVEASLLTKGFFIRKSQSINLSNEELQVEESLLSSGILVSGPVENESNDTPLRHLTKLDLSFNTFLTTSVLSYLLSLTHAAPSVFASSSIPLHSTSALTSVSLNGCENLSPLVLEALAFHCGATLSSIQLDQVTLDDEFGAFFQSNDSTTSSTEVKPLLSFPHLNILHLNGTDAPMPLLGRFLTEVIIPSNTLHTLSLVCLHPPLESSLAATPQVHQAALEETHAAEAERRRLDRLAIEEAARQRGLDLPSSSSATASATVSEEIESRIRLEEQQRRSFSGSFMRAIVALSSNSLRHLNLANNPDLTDEDLLQWMALAVDESQQDRYCRLDSLNLNGCTNISNEGLSPLLEVLFAKNSDMFVLVNDCPNVEIESLNPEWSWRVQGESFHL